MDSPLLWWPTQRLLSLRKLAILAFLVQTFPAFSAVLYKVSCGGPGGAGWVPDTPFVIGGSTQAVAGVSLLPYNFLRYAPPKSPISFSFPVSAATSVTLFFVEPRAVQTVGQRLFSVSLNGLAVLTDLDLFVSPGSLTPKSSTFPVQTFTGTLTIVLQSSVGNAVVSGILIEGDAPLMDVTGKKGPEAKRPTCPGIDLYLTTDTKRFFWCDGTAWQGGAPAVAGVPDEQHLAIDPNGRRVPLYTWAETEAQPAAVHACTLYTQLDGAGKFNGYLTECLP